MIMCYSTPRKLIQRTKFLFPFYFLVEISNQFLTLNKYLINVYIRYLTPRRKFFNSFCFTHGIFLQIIVVVIKLKFYNRQWVREHPSKISCKIWNLHSFREIQRLTTIFFYNHVFWPWFLEKLHFQMIKHKL